MECMCIFGNIVIECSFFNINNREFVGSYIVGSLGVNGRGLYGIFGIMWEKNHVSISSIGKLCSREDNLGFGNIRMERVKGYIERDWKD